MLNLLARVPRTIPQSCALTLTPSLFRSGLLSMFIILVLRVVNVASQGGLMKGRYSDEWIKRFTAKDLTLEQLTGYTEQFIQYV